MNDIHMYIWTSRLTDQLGSEGRVGENQNPKAVSGSLIIPEQKTLLFFLLMSSNIINCNHRPFLFAICFFIFNDSAENLS